MKFHSLEEIVAAAAEGVRPAEQMSVSEAAEKYRMLNNPGSYVGLWRNSKTPYMVEPMDTCTSLDFTGGAFVGPARTGKSDCFFNWLVHTVKCDPSDMMAIQMTMGNAREWSQGDLAKAIRNTDVLKEKLSTGRQKDNTYDKHFTNGMRLLIKWPTITELSGKTLRYVWLFDYDRLPQNVDKEGAPFDLARKRHQTFRRFGFTMAESSPGFPVSDPKWIATEPHEAPPTQGILALYNRGDRRLWHWRCPQCRDAFEADFKHLSYPDSADIHEAAEATVLICPLCGFPMEHGEFKEELNCGGKWIKAGQTWLPDGTVAGKPRRSDIASWWLKGPAAAFQTWSGLVLNYLQAKADFDRTGSEEALKVTTNVDQGHPYISVAQTTDRQPDMLRERAYDWGGSAEEPVVPEGVRYMTATVDVQAGGRPTFVVQVHGIGVGGDTWLVDMFKIRKSNRLDEHGERELLDPAGHPNDWRLLVDQVILKTYPLGDGSGRRMGIRITGCDSGGQAGVTKNAYAFWRWLRHNPDHDPTWVEGLTRRFHLIKGEGRPSAPRVQVRYPDVTRADRHAGSRGDVPVLFINTNMLKDQVYAALGSATPGSGMVHFPYWAEPWLYSQLTAEFRDSKGMWVNPAKKRNEAWDLLVYCHALNLHPWIKLEHIKWDKPPPWADVWDRNEFVFASGDNKGFANQQKVDYDLTKLAETMG